jgi:hypothetical protein
MCSYSPQCRSYSSLVSQPTACRHARAHVPLWPRLQRAQQQVLHVLVLERHHGHGAPRWRGRGRVARILRDPLWQQPPVVVGVTLTRPRAVLFFRTNLMTATLSKHCFLVLLPTLLATAAQSLPCRAMARLSAPSSTLLHESLTCLPSGSCMRPAATSAATLYLHCTLVFLPTMLATAAQSLPCRAAARLSAPSSTVLHESWTCLPSGSYMRPAATSTATLPLHCTLVFLPTLLATAAQSLPCRATARLSAPSSTLLHKSLLTVQSCCS